MRLLVAMALALTLASAGSPPHPVGTTALPPKPAGLDQRVAASLEAAKAHASHVWRDTATINTDGTINGYIEISRGESTKWEFDIGLNRRAVDRMIPPELGGYPINYGFMPRTVSYDGDPADVVVAGPPIEGGTLVRGRIIGLMEMVDSGDLDSKVVVSPVDGAGRALHTLTAEDRERIAQFFNTYKNHEGKSTKITGWSDEAAARAFIAQTAGFFQAGR